MKNLFVSLLEACLFAGGRNGAANYPVHLTQTLEARACPSGTCQRRYGSMNQQLSALHAVHTLHAAVAYPQECDDDADALLNYRARRAKHRRHRADHHHREEGVRLDAIGRVHFGTGRRTGRCITNEFRKSHNKATVPNPIKLQRRKKTYIT